MCVAVEHFPNVLPQTLIPETINKWAEKARHQHEAEEIKKGYILSRPFFVQHKSFRNGTGKSQHA